MPSAAVLLQTCLGSAWVMLAGRNAHDRKAPFYFAGWVLPFFELSRRLHGYGRVCSVTDAVLFAIVQLGLCQLAR